ncbi:hypothetical protein DFH28DRAFT_889146 [Melampsora americana]|nr:hypothetical protein DFH28DRAFT_889146 [Melampsora americana]
MTSFQSRPSKETINLIRLIHRLESHSQRILMPSLQSYHDSKPSDVDSEKWYWELKSLETTVRHAKTILDTLDSNPTTSQTISQIVAQDPSTLKHRLRVVQDRIQAALQECPPPTPPSTPPFRSRIKPPELPALPTCPPTNLPQPSPSDLLPHVDSEKLMTERPKSAELPLKQEVNPRQALLGGPKGGNKTMEAVLQHHRSNEDELSHELSEMAAQLKRNAHHFGKLLGEDRNLIENNATLLEQNHDQMRREGGRLGEVTVKGRQMTWFTIFSVTGVMIAWFMMFIIIRFS